MLHSVIGKYNCLILPGSSICCHYHFNRLIGMLLYKSNVIHGFYMPVMHLKCFPFCRYTRSKCQLVSCLPDTEERYCNKLLHPACRASIPGPSTTTRMR